MNKNWISLLIIACLTLALVFFWDTSPQALLGEKGEEKETLPSIYPNNIVTDHTSRHFNESGKLNHLFVANEVRHFQVHPKRQSKKDYTEISRPRLTLFREDAPPWKIISDTGHATANSSVITFEGNVMVWQIDPATGRRSELTTSKLVVKPDQHYAETDKPVMILAPDSTTSAVGMKALLNQDKIQLLSRVRGTYEAP